MRAQPPWAPTWPPEGCDARCAAAQPARGLRGVRGSTRNIKLGEATVHTGNSTLEEMKLPLSALKE